MALVRDEEKIQRDRATGKLIGGYPGAMLPREYYKESTEHNTAEQTRHDYIATQLAAWRESQAEQEQAATE